MRGLAKVGLIFALAVFLAYQLMQYIERTQRRMFPSSGLSLPTSLSLESIQSTESSLRLIFLHQYYPALLCFSLVYLIKQTFAIPGSLLLNLIAGWLLPFPTALLLTCVLTTTGASCCYFLSATCGDEPRLVKFADRWTPPGTLSRLRQELTQNHTSLFVTLVSARVFPFSPNWLLNLSSPWLHVPLPAFAGSVALGLLPYNLVTVQAGRAVASFTSTREALSATSLLVLLGLSGVLALASSRWKPKSRVREPKTQ